MNPLAPGTRRPAVKHLIPCSLQNAFPSKHSKSLHPSKAHRQNKLKLKFTFHLRQTSPPMHQRGAGCFPLCLKRSDRQRWSDLASIYLYEPDLD